MAKIVVLGATLQCSEGLSSATLIVTSQSMALGDSGPAATIMDFAPITNIPTFGMCNTQSNPAVAAATAAASGTHTPAPCIPVTTSSWSPGASNAQMNNFSALTEGSTCMCAYGGEISVTDPGQESIDVV
ncbi:DUF4280 domain-containing protein [Nitrosospira sp. Nsp13]|uniref:DUF4280 domain-containing protein n=1 Tax=Nitrosospira sp. Nsp13 TaxID=1855332 RepID=UPI00087E9A6A|nr:DUF4280 domain-containing protein [Nitrosospira sp. Nsp13]SCX79838.1 protein of unknown function [Nitrosospira sp. Nsp13]